MASEILIRQAEKMYESGIDTTDYAKLLTQPAVDVMTKKLELQKLKTEALIATMPAGVNIAKVPEELQGMVRNYLTENKAAYVEASKVVGSGIPADDPRYLEAIEKMNQIRGGFEALDASLVKIAENRKLSLDSLDSISPGATGPNEILHNKFANGEIYKELTLEGGNFYYTDASGNKINTNDYRGAMQQRTGITDSLDPLHTASIADKRNGEEFKEDWYRGKIRTSLKNSGKDGRVDFAYSGMAGEGSGQTEFIDKYIAEKHNITRESDPKEFERLYQSYKEADFSAGTELGNRLENYLVNTLRSSYDGAKVTTKGGTDVVGKFSKPEIYGAYRSKKDIDDMNEAIKNKQSFIIGFDNKKYTYNPATDKYEFGKETYSADDLRILQKIHGYKTGEDETTDEHERWLEKRKADIGKYTSKSKKYKIVAVNDDGSYIVEPSGGGARVTIPKPKP